MPVGCGPSRDKLRQHFLIRPEFTLEKCTVFEDGRGGEASESHVSYLDQHLIIGNVKIET